MNSHRVLAGDRQPWERQPDETAAQYAAFEAYLALGPSRTVVELAETMNRGITQVRGWYSSGQWGRRARAYDQEQTWRAELAAYREHEQAAARIRAAATSAATVAGQCLADADPEELDPVQASRMTTEAARSLHAVAATRPVPPPARSPLAEALATGGPAAAAAEAGQQQVEVTAGTVEQALTGSTSAAAQASIQLAAVQDAGEVDQVDTHALLRTLDAVLLHHPDARQAVVAALVGLAEPETTA